jgi:SAM-dependent methyltransferase
MDDMTGPTSPRYGLHADRYRKYRPTYPDWLFDRAAEACGEPHAFAVELGAGAGQATPKILARFERVRVIEPDADMAARIPPDPRLEVVVAPAETADLGQGVDAVFSATALHWMDARVVGKRAAAALRPGGVFLAFGYQPMEVVAPDLVVELIRRELAEAWTPYVEPQLSDWRPYPELIGRSGAFSHVQEIAFDLFEERTPESAAGLFLTTSYAAAHARSTGDEEGYLQDLAHRIAVAADGEPVTVRFQVTGGLARV